MLYSLRDIETIYVSEDKWNLKYEDDYIEERDRAYLEYK